MYIMLYISICRCADGTVLRSLCFTNSEFEALSRGNTGTVVSSSVAGKFWTRKIYPIASHFCHHLHQSLIPGQQSSNIWHDCRHNLSSFSGLITPLNVPDHRSFYASISNRLHNKSGRCPSLCLKRQSNCEKKRSCNFNVWMLATMSRYSTPSPGTPTSELAASSRTGIARTFLGTNHTTYTLAPCLSSYDQPPRILLAKNPL